jgi:hypothetical protein
MVRSMIDMVSNPRSDKIGGYDRYIVEDGVRTMQEAKRIERDPGLLRTIQEEADRQARELSSIGKKSTNKKREGV